MEEQAGNSSVQGYTGLGMEEAIFEVLWDSEERSKLSSRYVNLDPTVNEEHAKRMAFLIAQRLDADGWL